MSQTTAPAVNMDVGTDGLPGECTSPHRIETGVNTTQAMLFGRLASFLTSAQDQLKQPASAGDVTNLSAGVVVRRLTKVVDGSVTDPQYAAKDSVPYMRQGKVWVKVESAVTRGAQAFARHTAGNLGQFRHDADTANATLVPTAFYRTSAGAAGYALLEINLP